MHVRQSFGAHQLLRLLIRSVPRLGEEDWHCDFALHIGATEISGDETAVVPLIGHAETGAWERDDYWATTIILGTAYTARVTRSGWMIGIGGEYAFTNVLSGFVEYNYFDFGTRQIAFTPQVAGLGPAFADVTETKSVVRAGLNVRFGR